ncbi:MFS transporter [Sphingomonas sp. 1P06PA]|uniref:MFS transporter n=1 Tax=Sphingomonas sp. 1P06PA TaxID=554121 RepID=UPI0039A6FDFB
MSRAIRRSLGDDYVWVVVAATFLSLLVSAGMRAAPGVMMLPLERAFGWDRAMLSAAAGAGIFLYGLTGPFAGALMQAIGIRRTLLGGLLLMSAASLLSLGMREPWQYILCWGLLSGLGTGAVAPVLGAAIANRWFVARRGLVMGMLSASAATGALVFLPVLAWAGEAGGWRFVVLATGLAPLLLMPLVLWLVPERPAAIGIAPHGGQLQTAPETPVRAADTIAIAFAGLARAAREPIFWLLFSTFFVCGLTTNGLIGVHLIAYCGDMGLGAVQAAGLLAMMGVFDLVGTTASGWLTDRYDPRKLLCVYYALRGISLIALPYSGFDFASLTVFAVFYGLDWIATVPPTMKLTTEAFGDRDAPLIFGWVLVGHQLGAALAAVGAGAIRSASGSYLIAFLLAGAAAMLAGMASLAIRRPLRAAA